MLIRQAIMFPKLTLDVTNILYTSRLDAFFAIRGCASMTSLLRGRGFSQKVIKCDKGGVAAKK